MPLVLDSLVKALRSLENAIEFYDSSACSELPEERRDTIRAGVVQCFEYSYELCWKFIKRWLDENLGRIYTDGVSRRELFRRAAESLLIEEVQSWMDHHRARNLTNLTSHTYNLETAEEVLAGARDFLDDARRLLARLESENN